MDNEREICSVRLDSLISLGKESPYFPELLNEVITVCESLSIVEKDRILATLEQLWLPVALNLAAISRKLDRTLIQGILGGQGTGKTTLCRVLELILNYLGITSTTLSIDDLYLTYTERKTLQQQDPRLVWRGPPGTHDVNLGLQVIEQCLQGNNTTKILLPRFDKSAFNGVGDRTVPEAITKPDILLFEGWFVGVQPIAENSFNDCPKPIITAEDRQFAIDSNRRLQAYLPLWSKLDRLIVLSPEDYRLSKRWRQEAEHKMIAAGKTGMSDREIERFVEYFWKSLHPELFIKPLIETADLIVKIESDRTIDKVYQSNR